MQKYSKNKKNTVMTRDEVRAFDSRAINTLGIPGIVLMENAGCGCAELIRDKLTGITEPKVCIFCGTGNNGGDGYVIARHLLNFGFIVTVVISGNRSKMGQPINQLNLDDDDIAGCVEAFAAGVDLIVDGIFGTGLNGQLNNSYKQLIESINARNCPVLAVDIPSGLDCDTGEPLGAAIIAKYTMTFVAVKKGFLSAEANQYTGEIFIASIGVVPH